MKIKEKDFDVLCVGEMLADIIADGVHEVRFDADAVMADSIVVQPGGDAYNNSVDFSRLGCRVAYVGRAGLDSIGEFLLNQAQAEGINTEYVVRTQTPHSKVVLLINHCRERAFFYYAGTSAELKLTDIDLQLLKRCRLLVIGGTFHLPEFDGAGAAQLLQEAKKQGVITAMDVTKDFTGRWNETIKCCYPYLDYFLPSIEQAEMITGTKDEKQIADFFLSRGVRNVAVKLGKRGSYFKNRNNAFYTGTYTVPVKDSTGAGDAFVAGFLTGVLKNLSPEEAVRLGTACSAQVIQEVGANTGMKSLQEIQSFISRNETPEIRYV